MATWGGDIDKAVNASVLDIRQHAQQRAIVEQLRKMVCPTCGKTGAETNVTMFPINPKQMKPLCGECYAAAILTLCPPMYTPGGENDPNNTKEQLDG